LGPVLPALHSPEKHDGNSFRIHVWRRRPHHRAEYWLSILKFTAAGLLAAVILATAAGIATPLLVIAIVLVLIPWLMWGLATHTERLHDRSKSAWWLLAFYVIPGALGRLSSTMWLAGSAGLILYYVLELAAFALTIWGFVEIGCLRGIEGSNRYGPNPLWR
jgi:uncharacterized membrane protein YhaH (DUF805 family)